VIFEKIMKGEYILYLKFAELLVNHSKTAYRVAKDIGISTSTFSDWKSGRSIPKIDKLQKIANYFGVPISYFLDSDSQDKTA
jgi:transcriptional regulator with XRE-family HTH domain